MKFSINETNLGETVAIVVLAWFFVWIFLTPIVSAYHDATYYPASVYDLWNINAFREHLQQTRTLNYLRDNGWVKDCVDDDELDYILVLADHLSTYYDNIDPALIIAQIAVESRFDANAYNNGARGLMQLLPMYHQDRLIQFIEEDERYSRDLFYDERLNIITGMDYMSYILQETDGDETYALMWYNQGTLSACADYERNGIESRYAKDILALRDELANLINRKEG